METKTKLPRSEMKAFEAMARELPTKAQVEDIRKHVHKHIDAFDIDNKCFKGEFNKHMEIIRRYDEIIT